MVGLLTQLKEIDLSAIVGADHTGEAVAAIGLLIVLFEFLPILGQWIDGGSDGRTDANS